MKSILLMLFSLLIMVTIGSFVRVCFNNNIFHKKNHIEKTLKEIPSDEKWLLDFFFRNLLLKDSGAHVLHGCKPVELSSWLGPKYYLSTLHCRGYRRSTLLKKGYEVWKKHQHSFKLNNYCICYSEDVNDEEGFDVFLINKKNLFNIVSENIDEFKSVLGSELTPEALLEIIADAKNPLHTLLNQHPGLLGVILGYGKHNSWLFYHRDALQKEFTPKRIDIIEIQIKEITKQFQKFDSKIKPKRNCLVFSSLPVFVFDPTHEETRELNAKYREQRKEFTDLYKHGNFLEVVLRKLTD